MRNSELGMRNEESEKRTGNVLSMPPNRYSQFTIHNSLKDWEYRVIAVNAAGESIPSNTEAVVV